MGDRITVVGNLEDIERLADKLGNSMKRLNQPNLITIFVGIILGIILGSIDIGFGMKLGLNGEEVRLVVSACDAADYDEGYHCDYKSPDYPPHTGGVEYRCGEVFSCGDAYRSKEQAYAELAEQQRWPVSFLV